MADRQHLSELERKYNEICGITITNIFTLTKNCDSIPFWNVNINDPEHLYVLSVGHVLGSVVEKPVTVAGSKFLIWRLNRRLGLKRKGFKIQRMNGRDATFGVQPGMLVNDMRAMAEEKCGPSFTFGDIYREFYERKKK